MFDYKFATQSPLGGYKRNSTGVSISEITDRSITSIGIPIGGEKELSSALLEAFDIRLPEMGRFTTSGSENSQLLGLQNNQMFLVSDNLASHQSVPDNLKQNGYLTDQSDSWVILSVSGEKCRETFAKICPVDLHPNKFPEGKVLCTLMEHLGVIIYREDADTFCLLAPRSSSSSFLHALESAANAVLVNT